MVDVYVTASELRAVVGVSAGQDDRVNRACIMGTYWVRLYVGELAISDVPSDLPPFTLTQVATTPGRWAGALAAAVRVWNSPQAPFGVLGGLEDAAIYVNGRNIPEAEIFLLGERTGFGVA